MTAPHYIIAASREYAEKQARMIEANDIPALYASRAEADKALANYPNGAGVIYRVYEVERVSKAGDRAAAVTLVAITIAAWWLLPGEAYAAFEQRHAPVSAFDFWSIWIAGGVFLVAAALGVGAFVANAFRNLITPARPFYGENHDGND